MGGSLVFGVAVTTTTASANSGLAFVVLGSDNHFFCQLALVIASVGNDIIFGLWQRQRQQSLGWVLAIGSYSGNNGIAVLQQFKVFGGLL